MNILPSYTSSYIHVSHVQYMLLKLVATLSILFQDNYNFCSKQQCQLQMQLQNLPDLHATKSLPDSWRELYEDIGHLLLGVAYQDCLAFSKELHSSTVCTRLIWYTIQLIKKLFNRIKIAITLNSLHK